MCVLDGVSEDLPPGFHSSGSSEPSVLGYTSLTCKHMSNVQTPGRVDDYRGGFTTWWLIPLSKWVITPVISGLTLLIPFITGVITHLLSGMSHQVSNILWVNTIRCVNHWPFSIRGQQVLNTAHAEKLSEATSSKP